MNKKKGKTFINELLNLMEKGEASSTTLQIPKNQAGDKQEQDQKGREKQISITRRDTNFIRRLSKVSPTLSFHHIDKFFGMLPINTRSLQNPGYEESYLFTYTQGREVDRVYMYENALVFELTEPEPSPYQPPSEYLLEKYKSKNSREFYELAGIFEQLGALLKELGSPKPPESQLIKKYLDILGDKMYVGIFGPKKVVISKSMLTYLQYDVEQVALQTTKYRNLSLELYSSLMYPTIKTHIIQSFLHAARLALGKITLQDYQRLTCINYSDYIISKNNVLSYCDQKNYYITPNYFVNEIEHIHYKKDEVDLSKAAKSQIKSLVEDERERIRQAEYRVVKKLKHVPKGLLVSNQKLVAGYKELEKTDIKEHHIKKE